MNPNNIEQVLTRLRRALERGDIDAAQTVLDELRTPDQAQLVAQLEDDEITALLPRLDPADSADILEELGDQEAADLITSLPTEAAVRIVDEMEPDEAADLLGDVPPELATQILNRLEDPEEIHPLLVHLDTTAGGRMTPEFLALRRRMTAADALRAIREWKPGAEAVYYLYVVDRHGVLVGVVNLRQLIVADPQTLVADIMDPDVISVQAGTDQEEVARIIGRYDLLALPVVDPQGVLVGVVHIDDVLDVLEEEVTEDIQRLGGAQPLDEPYLRTGTLTVARKRIGWLMLLFLTGTLTGTVMRHFRDELQAVVTLAVFVPLLIGTGGNAGSQTTSTLIRALAVGDVRLGDALRALWHEIRVGMILGVGMGAIAYLRALLWGSAPSLAVTVSLAILTIVVWANALGAVLPMAAARLGIDPTVVSGPVMSTLVDATGLFLYFSIARVMLLR
jgi:magnesium transporter